MDELTQHPVTHRNSVMCTPLKVIQQETGGVLHGLKKSDAAFSTFGEVYFSIVNHLAVKGWRRHNRMTMNVIVVTGEVRFILFHEKENAGELLEYRLSRSNYCRLTIPSRILGRISRTIRLLKTS